MLPKISRLLGTSGFAEGVFRTTIWRRLWSRVKTPNPNLRWKKHFIFTHSSTIISKNSSVTILIGVWLCSVTGYVWGTNEILTCLVILHAFYSPRTLGIITTLTVLPCWCWIYGRHRALRPNHFGYSPVCIGTDLSLRPTLNQLSACFVAQAVDRRPLTKKDRVQIQANRCVICHRPSGTGLYFSPSTSVSPVSIIPPMLHTHSFIYHQRCIMFFSQHFSFPCQYHSTNTPYSFIHLPPTLYNVFLPVLQFPLSVSFHQYPIQIHLPLTLYSLGNALFRTKPATLGDTMDSVRHTVPSLNIPSLNSPCFTLNACLIK